MFYCMLCWPRVDPWRQCMRESSINIGCLCIYLDFILLVIFEGDGTHRNLNMISNDHFEHLIYRIIQIIQFTATLQYCECLLSRAWVALVVIHLHYPVTWPWPINLLWRCCGGETTATIAHHTYGLWLPGGRIPQ